ncbi:MAG: DNA repair protein RecN [Deltaproteobacteria bacterium]|nr:DNA repair protein RecN [Deltaproteobacteria bacterium]
MLRDLRIRDFAIIEDLLLTFDAGLNIITGDTGAGKSILIEALGLILGGRGSVDMIRTGAEEARITARFDLSGHPEKAASLAALGLEVDEDELIIHRALSRNGKGRVAVNGDPATVRMLTQIGEGLVDIHGQHEHHSLLKRENHLALLDAFGGSGDLRSAYRAAYDELTGLQKELEKLDQEEQDRERRIDFLQFQIDEIDAVAPVPEEDEALEEEVRLLSHAERITELAAESYRLLYEEEDSLYDRAGRLSALLSSLSEFDGRASGIADACEEVKFRLEDMAHSLRDHAGGIESDPAKLADREDRLEKLRTLKRKYGGTLAEVFDYRRKAEEELHRLHRAGENRSRLEEDFRNRLARTVDLAGKLSAKRHRASQRLEERLEQELAGLAMAGTRFAVEIVPVKPGGKDLQDGKGGTLTPTGYDRVEFMVSPNPGEEAKPLVRIASGGELSRIMLSIKTVLAGVDRVGVLIFDEVDSGVGGGIAEILGKRLREVAEGRQVICITHIPQVASQGQHHTHIAKEVIRGRTSVSAHPLTQEERVREIARMLGGVEITETTIRHAEEMLNRTA